MEYSGFLGMNLAQHFIGDTFQDAEIDFQNLETVKLKTKTLKSYEGNYWNESACFSRSIELRNDTLRYQRRDGRENSLIPISKNRFQMVIGGGEQVFITFNQDRMTFKSGDVRALEFERFSPSAASPPVTNFSGAYYNDLLNLVYKLETDDNGLYASHPKAGRIQLSHLYDNRYQGDRWFFASMVMHEDESGFTINTEQFKGLYFKRITGK
ncbi:MAG: hypothetical protein AAF616_13995 [Bacteroidota bacterium]